MNRIYRMGSAWAVGFFALVLFESDKLPILFILSKNPGTNPVNAERAENAEYKR